MRTESKLRRKLYTLNTQKPPILRSKFLMSGEGKRVGGNKCFYEGSFFGLFIGRGHAFPYRIFGKIRNRMEIEFCHDMLAVLFYGLYRRADPLGDFLCSFPFGDELKH